jgi:hypothetical protein
MSTRSSLRRKVVLALHVVRRSSGEKQLAHTLDVTRTSARLGGLNFMLEPGEVIEIRRGAIKARFEVAWVGASGSALDGQAGIRSLEPGKDIWGINLPHDEEDITVNAGMLRDSKPPVRTSSPAPVGRRAHERYPCSGSASIKSTGSSFALHGEIKDISKGGVYVELTAPMPVDTEVTIGLKIEGSWIEFGGTVRTSYPLVGMGVAFRKLTPANLEKLTGLLEKLRLKDCAQKSDFIVEFGLSGASETKSQSSHGVQSGRPDAYSLRVLALACRTLAHNFDSLQGQHSPTEIEELRLAITLLHQRLSLSSPVQLTELLASALPGSMA